MTRTEDPMTNTEDPMITTRIRRAMSLAVVALLALLVFPGTARAAEPVPIVHRETMSAGPYELTVGFSKWPLAEGVSFDLLIDPADGIADKTGTFTILSPNGMAFEYFEDEPLARHPRQRDSWGLDVVSFQDTGAGGPWTLDVSVDGPQGPGKARLVVPFEPLPGPPQAMSWLIATIPMVLIAAMILVAWIRLRPARQPDAWLLRTP